MPLQSEKLWFLIIFLNIKIKDKLLKETIARKDEAPSPKSQNNSEIMVSCRQSRRDRIFFMNATPHTRAITERLPMAVELTDLSFKYFLNILF